METSTNTNIDPEKKLPKFQLFDHLDPLFKIFQILLAVPYKLGNDGLIQSLNSRNKWINCSILSLAILVPILIEIWNNDFQITGLEYFMFLKRTTKIMGLGTTDNVTMIIIMNMLLFYNFVIYCILEKSFQITNDFMHCEQILQDQAELKKLSGSLVKVVVSIVLPIGICVMGCSFVTVFNASLFQSYTNVPYSLRIIFGIVSILGSSQLYLSPLVVFGLIRNLKIILQITVSVKMWLKQLQDYNKATISNSENDSQDQISELLRTGMAQTRLIMFGQRMTSTLFFADGFFTFFILNISVFSTLTFLYNTTPNLEQSLFSLIYFGNATCIAVRFYLTTTTNFQLKRIMKLANENLEKIIFQNYNVISTNVNLIKIKIIINRLEQLEPLDCGYFTVTREELVQYIILITTYSIILMQFKVAENV